MIKSVLFVCLFVRRWLCTKRKQKTLEIFAHTHRQFMSVAILIIKRCRFSTHTHTPRWGPRAPPKKKLDDLPKRLKSRSNGIDFNESDFKRLIYFSASFLGAIGSRKEWIFHVCVQTLSRQISIYYFGLCVFRKTHNIKLISIDKKTKKSAQYTHTVGRFMMIIIKNFTWKFFATVDKSTSSILGYFVYDQKTMNLNQNNQLQSIGRWVIELNVFFRNLAMKVTFTHRFAIFLLLWWNFLAIHKIKSRRKNMKKSRTFAENLDEICHFCKMKRIFNSLNFFFKPIVSFLLI